MKYWRVKAVTTVAAAVAASLGIYAGQEIEQNQEQQDQIEQTPPRMAGPSSIRTYLVRLQAEPVVRYRGSDPRFQSTAPGRGQKLAVDGNTYDSPAVGSLTAGANA